MRAFVLTAPGRAEVRDVPEPEPGPGEVVVAVERAGVCGTDVEFFTGEMAYLHSGEAAYPMRIGHEWCGVVASAGAGVDPAWVGRRVTGDTMLGCGTCDRCTAGRQHLCADRYEIGIRNGRPGALASVTFTSRTASRRATVSPPCRASPTSAASSRFRSPSGAESRSRTTSATPSAASAVIPISLRLSHPLLIAPLSPADGRCRKGGFKGRTAVAAA